MLTLLQLDGITFAQMIVQGANHLKNNSKVIDSLNVFPVPDGDTGTNMNLSLTSGANEVKKTQSKHIGTVGKSLSKGLLMGARGNSGVILSQLFRGFAKAIENKAEITSQEFAAAFTAGVNTAYKAVMKPVEGTILTVAKDAARRAEEVAKEENDIIQVMEKMLIEAKASLERTPELLPVLKEVGVVDSGGQGLVTIYEGFLAVLKGESLPKVSLIEPAMDDLIQATHHQSAQSNMRVEDIEFGYCTEFMVKFENDNQNSSAFDEDNFREKLSDFGDSLLVISNEDLVKVHIHAEHPGDVLTYAQQYGNLINIKIENMREQLTAILEEEKTKQQHEKREYGIIVVSMGSGITELFKSIGASIVIEGGQTMNPSTEDIVKAIQEVNAKKVIILPNNSNIIMAAQQAASVSEDEVIVVPSKSVPQGMAALFAFDDSISLSENEQQMNEALSNVKTGQVTYAVRDTVIDNLEIKKDEFVGIYNGKIVVTDKDKNIAAQKLLEKMIDENDEIITVLRGEDTTASDEADLAAFIEERFDHIEVEAHVGNQPLYSYIFSVE